MLRRMILGLVVVFSLCGVASATTWYARYGHSTWTDLAPSNPYQCLSLAETETESAYTAANSKRTDVINKRSETWTKYLAMQTAIENLNTYISAYNITLDEGQTEILESITSLQQFVEGRMDMESSGTGLEESEFTGTEGFWFGYNWSPENWERAFGKIADYHDGFLNEVESADTYVQKCNYYDGTSCYFFYDAKNYFQTFYNEWTETYEAADSALIAAELLLGELNP